MKFISQKIVKAVNYYNAHSESMTKVSEKFDIDRHTLSKYLHVDLSLYEPSHCDSRYVLYSEREKDMVNEYCDEEGISYRKLVKKYHFKESTIKRVLTFKGINYHTGGAKYTFNRHAFHNINSQECAYIIGFLLADGYVHEKRNFLKIKLHNRDRDILEKINMYLQSNVPIHTEYHTITHNPACSLLFYSKEMVADLSKYHIYQGKTGKEQFYEEMPQEYMLDYIRGIIDGDGFIRQNMKQIGLCGSYNVLYHVCDYLINRLGLDLCTENKIRVEKTKNSVLYRMEFTGNNAGKIITALYRNCKISLDRKYNLAKKYFIL